MLDIKIERLTGKNLILDQGLVHSARAPDGVRSLLTRFRVSRWSLVLPIQHSLDSTSSVFSGNTSDDVRETKIFTTNRKSTSMKPPLVVPAYFKPMYTLHQLLVRSKDKIFKEPIVGQVYHIP